MCEGGEDCLKYLKRGWNRKKGRRNEGKGESWVIGVGVLNGGGGGSGNPFQTIIALIINCIDAGCTSSTGNIPLLVSLIFYI